MGFVKTAEECQAIQRFFARPRWLLDGVRVRFETTTDFIRSVLPPCLEPVADASGVLSVGRWQSACCGEFDTASVYVSCTDGEVEGLYNLAMIVTGDTPVTWGREVWGEVKKRGEIGYFRAPSSIYAYADRNGTRLIEIEARIDGPETTTAASGWCFEVKAFPAANGIGLEHAPRLVRVRVTSEAAQEHAGTARVRLRGTDFDPLDTIPITGLARASHVSDRPVYEVTDVRELPNPEAYIPYVYGRHYDDLTKFRVPDELSSS